ncbi:MAG: hypothetical protein RIE06_27815 [Roseibium album]|uniref:hypothetical protein n=1 Tax=Roseibium album TaxID=311410 RepID=UPI0032EE2198
MRASLRLLGVASVIILARVLVPEDYGIVAKAVELLLLLGCCAHWRFQQPTLHQPDLASVLYAYAAVSFVGGFVMDFATRPQRITRLKVLHALRAMSMDPKLM